MKLLFDFLPVILFFVAYQVWDIYVATAAAIVAGVLQIGGFWLKNRRFEKMHVITLALLVVLGGATLVLRDPRFIMWKVTAVNWAFAVAFLISPLFGGKTLIERMMASAVSLPKQVWARLNALWAGFFVFVGLVNIYFVLRAMEAREAFFAPAALEAKTDVKSLNCVEQFAGDVVQLCEQAALAEASWVDFKLFGVLGLTVVFVIGQAFYLSRHIEPEDGTTSEPKP